MAEFRNRAVESLEQDLCLEVKICEKKLEKIKRTTRIVSSALTVCSTLNVLSASSALGSGITGIGIIVCAPLGTLAVINSIAILVLNTFSKRKKKRLKLLEKRLALARKFEFKVANKISQALKDDKISGEEFESILDIISTFYDEQQKIKDTADPLDLKTEGNSSEKSNPVKMNILSN